MTLTPQRDTINRIFARARDDAAKLPAGDAVDQIGHEASLAAVEAVMGAMADMMDMGAEPRRIHKHFANILANITSHSLSLAGSDRVMAAGFAVEMLGQIGHQCRVALARKSSDVEIVEPLASTVAGRA